MGLDLNLPTTRVHRPVWPTVPIPEIRARQAVCERVAQALSLVCGDADLPDPAAEGASPAARWVALRVAELQAPGRQAR